MLKAVFGLMLLVYVLFDKHRLEVDDKQSPDFVAD